MDIVTRGLFCLPIFEGVRAKNRELAVVLNIDKEIVVLLVEPKDGLTELSQRGVENKVVVDDSFFVFKA